MNTGNNERSKEDKLRHLLHKCNKYVFYHAGPGVQQCKALGILKSGPMSQKDLQEQLGVQPASVSELISKLEGRGLVERSRSDSDRRVVMLSLTDSGMKIADKAVKTVPSNELFSCLDGNEQDQLIALLEKLDRSFSEKNSKE